MSKEGGKIWYAYLNNEELYGIGGEESIWQNSL